MNREVIGWVVSLWIDVSQIQLNNRKDLPYLSWSPYDRVTIDEVKEFSDFFITKESSNWNGTVQRLHLIPMGECQWSPGKDCLISTGSNKKDDYGIYCIVTARFQYRFKNVEYVEKCVCEWISECLQEKNVQWQGFRSLGAEDFVGILLADTVEELAGAIEIIKQITYTNNGKQNEVFGSVCSFLGLNDPEFVQEPKADLNVKIHLKSSLTSEKVCEELNKYFSTMFDDDASSINIREIISGKNCLEIIIPNHYNILSCFHNNKNAIFNGQSEFYDKYIESSRTYWYVPQDKVFNYEGNIGEVDIYEEKEKKNNISESLNIHPISKFILKEYERMINSHRCLWWKPILQNQYDTYAEFVKEYTQEKDETALCTLNNKVQTVLLHINQATAPVSEVPYHNYYYSGSYNDVLRMYYGVIAAIFNIAYKLPRSEDTYQYEITYCVDFEATTKVHSSMYKMKNDKRRFVIFHLPYDAFMKFDKTIKLLLHEVFHYVAPFSRKNRNLIFIKIWTIIVFEQYNSLLEKEGLKPEDSKNIVEYFYEHYGELCKTIVGEIGDKLDEKILNDFTTINKVKKLQDIPEKICEIICNKLNQEVGLWLKEVKDSCTYKMVYPYLFGSKNKEFLMESIRRIALAAKEAFCDLNMIYILKLPLSDYIMLIYDMLFEKYNNVRVEWKLEELVRKGSISLGSFELRIGMVIDYYIRNKLGEVEPEQYRDFFDKEISEIKCKDNEDTFVLFCEHIDRVYDLYLKKYRKEHLLFQELFYGENQWFVSFEKDEYGQDKLIKATSIKNQIFDNISTILDFVNVVIDRNQVHDNKKRINMIGYSNIKSKWQKDRVEICDLGDYVEQSCRIIQEWGEDTIWFRGICNDSFPLLPSLFRKLDYELSLYANQAKFLKDAYYITISESALWKEQIRGTLKHMCLLQHYGIPTSLLDFSDDMLVALHFALNPDIPDDLRKVDEYIYQPKVVLFNPFKYNEAIMYMQTGGLINQAKNISPFLLDVHDDLLSEYCVDNMSEEYLRRHSQEFTESYRPNPRINKYPRPVAVGRENARIQAQKGTFLAYNLSALPEKEGKIKDDYYDYLCLGRIQEDYLKILEEQNIPSEKGEFIKEIYINKMAISTIKEQLKIMNITTAHVYPELYRLFTEYMEKKNIKELTSKKIKN